MCPESRLTLKERELSGYLGCGTHNDKDRWKYQPLDRAIHYIKWLKRKRKSNLTTSSSSICPCGTTASVAEDWLFSLVSIGFLGLESLATTLAPSVTSMSSAKSAVAMVFSTGCFFFILPWRAGAVLIVVSELVLSFLCAVSTDCWAASVIKNKIYKLTQYDTTTSSTKRYFH